VHSETTRHQIENCINSLAPSMGTKYRFSQKKSAMVTTRSEDARRVRNVQDDATTSNDPQATISFLNERIAQMSKSMETLTKQNAALIRHISE